MKTDGRINCMEKLWISPVIDGYAREYKDYLAKYYESETKTLLTKMRAVIKEDEQFDDYRACIDLIIDEYETLILAKEEKFDSWNNRFSSRNFSRTDWIDPSYEPEDGEPKFSGKFYEAVMSALKYKIIRKTKYAEIIKKMGIRTCIYCNAEYLPIAENHEVDDTIEEEQTEDDAKIEACLCRFEADHYKPESQFPFLGISFFNLLPSCPFCNKSKTNKPCDFYLYTSDENEKSPFSFKVDYNNVLAYIDKYDSNILEVLFECNSDTLLANYNDLFHIDKIYKKSFNDEIEDLIWKSETENDAYIEQLNCAFDAVFPKNSSADKFRFINGFYIDKKDVFKRPLQKLKQDIFKQLEIDKRRNI